MSLRFIMWNVQHGSAAFIQTPNGKNIVIDLGASDAFSPLQALRDAGINWIDQVTITHPHMDHIDDILNFDKLVPKTLLAPKYLSEDEIRGGNPKLSGEPEAKIQKYLEVTRKYTVPVDSQNHVGFPQNNGGVSIKTFVSTGCSRGNVNNHSVVTALEYGGVKILVPGDNEAPSWEELLSQQDFVDAIKGTHVLVAAHHGRESGFYRPLFDHFRPYITLVSDGRSVDTSATGRYTGVTTGWDVHRRSGGMQKRYCLTTRNDGCLDVGITPIPGQIGSLKVTID